MIRSYPRMPSVFPGELLTLHVSTDRPQFRIEFFRQGTEFDRVEGADTGPLPGVLCLDGPPDQDWAWPAYRISIPADWRSGVYVAMLVEIGEDGERLPDTSTPDGPAAKALFAVRSPNPGNDTSILYKLSWATYHAYNGTGYGSLYAEALWSREYPFPGFKVTTRRPGGGTGGAVEPGDSVDHYDPGSRRQTFAHWDAPFISWLEREGYRLDYCTDFDLHRDPELLTPYQLLLSVGHDEYWSEAMRSKIDSFVQGGGNVAYFSGNIAGWRIHFTDDDTAIVCAKVKPTSREVEEWDRDEWQGFNPENRVTGVSLHNAGGWWNGPRDTVGYEVQHAAHWAFEGTGLADGDVFGDDEDFPLLGYECDGADYTIRNGVAVATGENGTPLDFFILGLAPLGEGWSSKRLHPAATMGVFTSPRGGVVFQGATTDWPIVAARNAHVQRITRNVIDRLRLRSVRLVGPLPTRGGRMLVAEGETASFHADTAELGETELRYEWHVGGAEKVSEYGSTVRVLIPSHSRPVTVSLIVSVGSEAVAFGTRTFVPLTSIESLQLEACILVREIAMPGEPSNPWVGPTADPLTLARSGIVIPVHLPRLREHAGRLEQVAVQLMERLESDDGTSFVAGTDLDAGRVTE